jgi:hypothetical protein
MLQDAGAIADLIGAIGVIVSLIFVGLQIRQANQLAREAAEQKQIESIGSLSRIVAEHPHLADLMARGQAGEKLTVAENIALTSMITHGQRTWEALYYQYRAGRVDPELWEAHRRQARAMQNTPMGKAMWKLRKDWFSKSYQDFRDADGAGQEAGTLSYKDSAQAPEPAAPPAEAPKQ